MHLKTLEIQGFKSFPERTVIEFHAGVTAIIGPNGSGKSNVTDAIRWVLGEQSVRTLRGTRMEDVIFTGTQSRRAMGLAEVTITFDNSDQALPLAYSEVQVTRRLYRSGDSEYLLNKTSCRLKDITALFMDTGLGRDGYSIIGQGRVDDLLSHRSEDRRRIFEEASGIVKYKTRKEEAERKLEQTEQNLLRINDLVQELALRVEPLAAQAATARQFLTLQNDLKGLEIALMLETLNENQQKLTAVSAARDLLQADLDQAQIQLGGLREQHRQSTEQIRSLEADIEAQREIFNQQNTRMGELAGQKARHAERRDLLQRQLQQSGHERLDLEAQLVSLQQDLAVRSKKAGTLQRQQHTYQLAANRVADQLSVLLASLNAAQQLIEQHKQDLEGRVEVLYELKNQAGQLQSQLPHVENRRRSLQQETRDCHSDLSRLDFQHEEQADSLAALDLASRQGQQQRLQAEQALQQARQTLTAAQARLEQLHRQQREKAYQQKLLQDLEKNHEGYGDTVKRLLRQADENPEFGRGIRGTIGEQIRVAAEYELAIEIALGGAISHIITDTEATARRLIDYLKQNRAGRTTFLPIESIRGRQLEPGLLEKVQSSPGFIGLASQLVRVAPDLQAVISSLLGRVLLAKDLEAASAMARRLQYACRIVTLEGDVINPGGSMTGGFHKPGPSGTLGRSREIAALQASSEQLEQLIADGQGSLAALTEDMQTCDRNLAACEQQLLQLSHQRIREEARLTATETEKKRLQGRLAVLGKEDSQLAAQLGRIHADQDRILAAIQEQEQQTGQLRLLISQQEGENRDEQQRRDDLREELSDLRLSLHAIEESLASAAELTLRLEQEQKQAQHQLIRQQVETIERESEIRRLAAGDDELDSQLQQARRQSQQAMAQIQRINERREQLEARQSRFFDHLESATSRISALQTEIGKIDAQRERCEQVSDEVKNRLWETYEMTADMAGAWRRPIENRNETVRQVNSLRQAIKALGPINLAAIDEHQAIAERFAFLCHQRDDIEGARQKLQAVITDLTTAMKKQFVDHFQRINENFKQVFGELFGGGLAEISLENTPDVLTASIEIKAQPPGKKLQNMLLLSGGERCLTAIALLFAIFKLRPTPFCILDEVEAALDDANVFRFTEYIRHYADESQFILVTHRKGTMEAADRLYGVTMPERGISRILSMQLSQA